MSDAKELQQLLVDQIGILAHRLDLQIQATRVLRDENDSIKRKLEWQPIETAPQYGSEWILLGYYPDYMEGECQGGHPIIAYWDGDTWADCSGRRLAKEGVFSPTHWMLLPYPPRKKGGA